MEDQDRELLIRIDERTEALKSDVEEIKESLDQRYVTQKEFNVIQRVVYGALTFIVTSIVAGVSWAFSGPHTH